MTRSPIPDLRATFFLRDRLSPDPAITTHGIVMDVAVDGGLDTLAAYADGTARYINHSGSTIIWEAVIDQDPIGDAVARLLTVAAHAPAAPLRRYGEPVPEEVDDGLATILTADGMVAVPLGEDRLSNALMSAGAGLMQLLIEQVKESR
jgi:hypothetical protein